MEAVQEYKYKYIYWQNFLYTLVKLGHAQNLATHDK